MLSERKYLLPQKQTHLLHQGDFPTSDCVKSRLNRNNVWKSICRTEKKIDFRTEKIGYKKAVHGSSHPEGFTIFLERKMFLLPGA
ncbi:hypothetical protein CEXT_789721 [Caerostris extrusa]|uniref:Uncharacterized protein n=1 Tax=Caerostris extrusa TaxID=172846 RepID=A0AAV4YD03_CAEEX|nr:hypothetical protein CEXT_789721 [Caerostris extrusa]